MTYAAQRCICRPMPTACTWPHCCPPLNAVVPPQPKGCICPAGSDVTCKRPDCGRKPEGWMRSLPRVVPAPPTTTEGASDE